MRPGIPMSAGLVSFLLTYLGVLGVLIEAPAAVSFNDL